jgi:tetratricopeptide (TPR) repeat protein
MGLWSWLFPSPEQRLERARADLLGGRYNDARTAALELNLPGAAEIVEQAGIGLCRLNLAHAVSWAQAGDEEKVQQHLELAETFRHVQTAADIADALRQVRDIRRAQEAEVMAQARVEEARREAVDGRFHEQHGLPALPIPEGLADEEIEAMEVRLALLHESYPEDLRDDMVTLGPDFSQAVFEIEESKPADALRKLYAMPESPLVLHERGRAALAVGDLTAAVAAWTTFGQAVGHREMGHAHTATLLAHAQAQLGDLQAALATLRAARKEKPDVGGTLYPALLEATGDLPGAEKDLLAMLKRHGPQASLYNQLARVREAGGYRMEAMQALETALRTCGCGTGACGTKPPDAATYRMLATLYLEDGIERDRALELAETAIGMVRQPAWEDLYLATLAARARAEDTWTGLAERLRGVTSGADPRRAKLDRYLPA